MDKIKILYIDDELNNLNSFKAAFRFDFNILTAASAADAKILLQNHDDIKIILSDQRMPDETGVQFFETIRTEYPKPIRMLITGYTDLEAVIDGINKGHIFRYIKKPWTDDEIRAAIEEANKFFITSSLLEEKNKELQTAYDELGKFAYSVTHDMRGPILGVMAANEILKTTENIEEVREIALMMSSAMKQLDEFVINLHEYYNLKRGSVEYTEIDFNALVNEVASFFRIAGSMENIRFTLKVSQSDTFLSDKILLKIILNNLLSNAFKYQRKSAAEKFVEIEIVAESDAAAIYVKDNGIGIHSNYINNIFTMFYRATSQDHGSGFGLYNVKDALNRLNGKIEVTSTLNEGTVFKVIIPGRGYGSK